MKKVLVLMSTYNGEHFLKEQIESVMRQSEVELTLLIRDDGSQDNTINIINDAKNGCGNIVLIQGENCGSALSFLMLLKIAVEKYADYDYIAFCDQDDVWEQDKLASAVRVLDKHSKEEPCLYMGAYQMVDVNLNVIETTRRVPRINLAAAIASNLATGCTMVFNYYLANLVVQDNIPKDIVMHDYWIYLVCLVVKGFVYYDETPHILYRQHDKNVIGGKSDPFLKKWKVRFIKLLKSGDCFKSKLSTELLKGYSFFINDDDKLFLMDVSTNQKLSSKIHLLFNKHFRADSIDKNLQLFGLIVSGKL